MKTKIETYEKIFILATLLVSFAFYLVFIFRTSFTIKDEIFFTLIDDAMISMRYAKNFANGYGLVWNPGEPPVQGFTNLGWTLIMTILHKFPIPESKISILVMITASIILLGNAYMAYRLAFSISPNLEIAPKIALIVTSFYYPLVYWSLRGMETGLLTLLISSLVLIILNENYHSWIRRSLLIGGLVIAAILVRMDIVLQLVIVLIYYSYRHISEDKPKLLEPLVAWFFFLVGVVGLLLFQYHYFGSVFPNTYYLKVEGISFATKVNVGLQTLILNSSGDFNFLLFFVIAGLIIFKDLRNKKVVLILALFLIQCLYSIYIGGDYNEGIFSNNVESANRFIAQGMPFLIALFSISVEQFIVGIYQGIRQRTKFFFGFQSSVNIATIISFAILVIISGKPWFAWTIYNAPALPRDISNAKLGMHIFENTEEDVVIAVHGAGQIPYYSNRISIDLLGKSDPIIAKSQAVPGILFVPGHIKWNYKYSIQDLKPDIIADGGTFLTEFLNENQGYSQLENGIWIRKDFMPKDFAGLSKNYQ